MTDGKLSPLIHQYENIPPAGPLAPETSAVLDRLYRLAHDTSLPGAEELKDGSISTAYFSAIHDLKASFEKFPPGGDGVLGNIFSWPVTVAERFVELLEERRERALVVFAHYCVLFTMAEGSFWWRERVAEWEVSRIVGLLGEEWRSWVEWPMEKVRELKEVRERRRREARSGGAVGGDGAKERINGRSMEREAAETAAAQRDVSMVGSNSPGVGLGHHHHHHGHRIPPEEAAEAIVCGPVLPKRVNEPPSTEVEMVESSLDRTVAPDNPQGV